MKKSAIHQAVLFADISGSGTLFAKMGDNVAMRVVDAFVDVGERVTRECRGLFVKSVGDAVLCLFPTADSALLAASALQTEVCSRPIADQDLRIHIGFSFGPVVAENNDVFGDTVNIAAYLTNMAAPDQILTTESTHFLLSERLRELSRPIFRTRVKGTEHETTICEVLWRPDTSTATDINPDAFQMLPADEGALLLEWNGGLIRVDALRSQVVIGRGAHCDLVIPGRFVSREHAFVRSEGPTYLLEDRSTNGTLVVFDDGHALRAFRREIPLEGSGQILVGALKEGDDTMRVRFSHDRRSHYRI